MKRKLLLSFLFGAIAKAVVAQPSMQLEPEIVFCSVRDAYRGRAVVERVTIDVRTRDSQSSDSLTLWIEEDERRVTLELGQVVAQITPNGLLAVHSLNALDVLEVQNSGRDVAEMLRASLPPLPLPQIEWALNGGCIPDLRPFAHPVEWKQVVVPPADSGVLVVEGRSAHREIRMTVDEGTGQLRSLVLNDPGNQIRIDVSVKPLSMNDVPRPEVDADGRTRIQAFRELKPRPGDIGIGKRLPDLLLISAPVESRNAVRREPAPTFRQASDLDAPGAIVLFRGKGQSVRAAAEALRASGAGSLETHPLGGYFIAVVNDEGRADRNLLGGLSELVAPSALHISSSAPSTIDRFAPEWFGVVVVFDNLWRVSDLIRLPSDEELGEGGKAQNERLRNLDELKRRIGESLRN